MLRSIIYLGLGATIALCGCSPVDTQVGAAVDADAATLVDGAFDAFEVDAAAADTIDVDADDSNDEYDSGDVTAADSGDSAGDTDNSDVSDAAGQADASDASDTGGVVCPTLPPLTPAYPTVKRVFRQGQDGYEGTVDLHLSLPKDFYMSGTRTSQFPTDPEGPAFEWGVEDTFGFGAVSHNSKSFAFGVGDAVGLLRFDDVVGNGAQQVPPGAIVVAAELALTAKVAGDPATVHRALVPWGAHTRWASFGLAPGPQFGADIHAEVQALLAPEKGPMGLDVKEDVQGWANATLPNDGWVFVPTATATMVEVQNSGLGKLTAIRVALSIKSDRRGELVATLRHDNKVAVLLNRLGRHVCHGNSGHTVADLDILLDDAAPIDVHNADAVMSPLKGTFRPDASCISAPLCPAKDKGLCGESPNGLWQLSVRDEWTTASTNGTLVAGSLELQDATGKKESYAFIAGQTIPNASVGDITTAVWSSEAASAALRPTLTVETLPGLQFAAANASAILGGSGHLALRIPPGSNAAADVHVALAVDPPGALTLPPCGVTFAQGGPTSIDIPIGFGQATDEPATVLLTATSQGLTASTTSLALSKAAPAVGANDVYLQVGAPAQKVTLTLPLGANGDGPINVELKSDNAAVLPIGGGSSASLALAQGAAPTITFGLLAGAVVGDATLSVSDKSGKIALSNINVHVSASAWEQHEWLVEPTMQVGPTLPGAKVTTATLAFQTTVVRRGGPVADTFAVEVRALPSGAWKPASGVITSEVGSTSRIRHVATLSEIAADSPYAWRVTQLRNGKPVGTPLEANFLGRPAGAFRVTAFGNGGLGTSVQDDVAKLTATLTPDLHLGLGDNVYDSGGWEHYAARMFWPYQTMTRAVPYVSALGNHDATTEKGVALVASQVVPANTPAFALAGRTFVFDYGNARFFVLNTSLNESLDPFAPWLKSAITASTQTWNIVVSHELPLQLDPYQIDRVATESVRKFVLAAAVEAGADVFIGGAAHSFQRYLPITAVPADKGSVTWAQCATGKGMTVVYPGTGSWARLPAGKLPTPLQAPLVTYLPVVGTGVFDFNGDKLTISFVQVGGAVGDTVTLTKCTGNACACP